MGEKQRIGQDAVRTELLTLIDFFEDRARMCPEAPAVWYREFSLTYSELDLAANELAWKLIDRGCRPETVVGICANRSPNLVVGLLGVLKAGAAYLPLNPDLPRERLVFMAKDSGAELLLADEHLVARFNGTGLRVEQLTASALHNKSITKPPLRLSQHNLAYVIYTSGSTGRPKGVMIPHKGVANRLQWMQEAFPLVSDDRVLQKTPIDFDVSVWELFWPLISGAQLVLAETGGHRDPAYLVKLINALRITIVHFVPSMLRLFLEQEDLHRCKSLRRVFVSGEPLSFQLQQRFYERLDCELHNLYGPTEASIDVSHWPCNRCTVDRVVPIGWPIKATRIYVLRDDMSSTEPGEVGEIYIGGAGLARGYIGQPTLTSRVFVPDPFDASGGRLYKSGDLGRYRSDGTIEFVGRVDEQVKLRGFRIELREIQVALETHPSVKSSVVIVGENDQGDKELVAFVVTRADFSKAEDALRGHLEVQLPYYMLPSRYIFLTDMPLLKNGKVDRQALRELVARDRYAEQTRPEAEEPIDAVVLKICRRIVGVPIINADDSLLALGCDSLRMIQIVSRVNSIFGVDIAVNDLFLTPTAAHLTHRIKSAVAVGQKSVPPTPQSEPIKDSGPLSSSQERLWFISQLVPGDVTYNVGVGLRFPAKHPEIIRRCLNKLVERHPALRTTFVIHEGRLAQRVAPEQAVSLEIVPAGGGGDRSITDHVHQFVRIPFDLRAGPVARFMLIEYGGTEQILIAAMHHIVCDGRSWLTLANEFEILVARLSGQSEVPDLEPTGLQPSDYACWQRASLDGKLERQLAFWRTLLGSDPPRLALSHTHDSDLDSPKGAVVEFWVPPKIVKKLAELSGEVGATLFMGLMAVFNVLIARVFHSRDFIMGTFVSDRTLEQLESTVGFFVNTLPLRLDLSGDPSFIDVLTMTRKLVLGAFANRDVPFQRIIRGLNLPRKVAQDPLVEVAMVMQEEFHSLGLLPLRSFEVHTGTSKYSLKLDVAPAGEALACFFEYKTSLFTRAEVERMATHYAALMELVVSAPGSSVFSHDFISLGFSSQLPKSRFLSGTPPKSSDGCRRS